ncbi:hypothetical protein C5688_09090 [Methylocystis sp. MitZ-2018]|nr:hypothetical protein C5688_09090 [Methylocystis sp. MitZ-2018]
MSAKVHPLDKLAEFEADCASGAWDRSAGNFWQWFATCYPLARQMAAVNGAAKPEHFAPELKRALPAHSSKSVRDNHGWGEVVARLNAKFDEERG